MKRVLGREHPTTPQCALAHARCFVCAGRVNDAIALTSETLETNQRVMGSKHPQSLRTGQFLGMMETMVDLSSHKSAAAGAGNVGLRGSKAREASNEKSASRYKHPTNHPANKTNTN